MSEPQRPGPKRRILQPTVEERLLNALKVGATHELACKHAGIAPSTFYAAMARGRAAMPGDEDFVEFAQRVNEAEAGAAVVSLATIRKASATQWQAAAWLLERRYPNAYGRTVVAVQDAGVVDLADRADADLEARARALAAAVLGEVEKPPQVEDGGEG